MNIQAMAKQMQKLQADMMKAKKEIDETTFTGESSFVHVKVSGEKKVLEVKILEKNLKEDDVEMLEDMLVIALNNAFEQVDKITEEKLGKYTKGMPGLF
ncbi:MAG: YbaB/EbfC family nucleoid-associated protein [Clostridium sp.]|nr:YbaB/EbfC family nucleoid-associated protein [Clostridium sp.]MCM1443778.1 YbaB/EbfC family nucleoid-associated protein [Candidatus Amulumruptor caecigallinarius]